jgi:multiple sugar transport system substrate-binding protein
MRKLLTASLFATTAILPALLTPANAADVTVSYWMWDGNQAPVYRQCADKFEAANPGVKVQIGQDGWDNYWTKLTTGFTSGAAPDVFVNHISRFPEFLANGVMEDLTGRIAADKVDMKAYLPGLAESWNKDGKQWGLPKDWDTIAIFYNKKMVADAGIKEDELANLDWNPDDGGSFEKALAKLTVDAKGKHGDQPGFDPKNIAVYGWSYDPPDGFGQQEFSHFAASAGFKAVDKPWGTKYFYDSPILAKTLTWLRDLSLVKGFSTNGEQVGRLGPSPLFAAGKIAMAPQGSWMLSTYRDNVKFAWGVAPLPKGPEGRKSMFNGLADSIWSGSKNKDAAWAWVKYLGSSECQTIVGKAGVVFPARPEAVDAAVKAHQEKGIDVSAFTLLAKPGSTFPYPIMDHGSEAYAILKTAVTNVLLNQGDPAKILKDANDEVNKLF